MKISIITIHGILNFGSVFQSYGLCKFLQNNGYDVEVIDYNPPYYVSNSLRSRLGRLINIGSHIRRSKKFRSFIEKNLPLTEKSCVSYEELKAAGYEADVFIAGGDQLWNVYYPCGNDDAYKLTFVNGKKISYGTSMGQKGFDNEQLNALAEKLKSFSAVSVRESSSVGLLKSVGIDAVHSVDPVFLLDAKDYDKFLVPVNEPKYMVVYLVKPSELLEKCIAYLSKKHNLKVILCSGLSKRCTCDEIKKDIGPDEMLSYIKNAEFVLSSSFHATAFSMLFEKQFFTILPNKHTNERITDILTIRGLQDRIITDETELESALDSVIDYKAVKPYDGLVEDSRNYLLNALKD